MSSILRSAVVAVFCGVASPALTDGLPAAITPPFPKAALPSPEVPDTDILTLTRFNAAPVSSREVPDDIAEVVARQANISNFGTACGPSLSVSATSGAMLSVRLSAPCLPYDTVRLEHAGLAFTLPMPMTGELSFLLPALSEIGSLSVTLSDNTTLTASTPVPDAGGFARVALQWNGEDHGELIAKAPRQLDGQMFRIGQSLDESGAVLQVFSRRIDDLAASGVVRLSMRTRVTTANCDTGQTARVRRVVPHEPVSTYDLKLMGRGCKAVGQSLELKNILQDLKLAGN